MRHVTFVVLALSVGLLLGGSFVAPAEGRGPQIFPKPYVESLPPHPSQVVNLNVILQPVHLPQDVPHVVYAVPADTWLVVTDYAGRAAATGEYFVIEQVQAGVRTVKLDETFSVTYQSGESPKHFRPAVGLAFEPGSSVAITGKSFNAPNVAVHLTGYLVPR